MQEKSSLMLPNYLQIVMYVSYSCNHHIPSKNRPQNGCPELSLLWAVGGTIQGERGLCAHRDFPFTRLGKRFATSMVWSDNGLTLILLFSAGTKVRPGCYHPLVICVAWRNSGKVQEKGGGIVAASCWPAHWPIVAVIFLSYHITIISATSSFHPGSDTVFIDLH